MDFPCNKYPKLTIVLNMYFFNEKQEMECVCAYQYTKLQLRLCVYSEYCAFKMKQNS